ncbi:Luciferin 4-monooxygenase [Operophtera brumata]|uniref:Luciferin 4-monooxygenase n=1 Tax=Operophtera brumata TaxID=104452 RepID=A0A0L7LH10_OPEBR|nr:Luciferin 4-monooxygenase [Operophtera brumata]
MSISKYYVYGKDVQVPAHLNFGKFILDRLRTYKDEIALEYMDTNEKLSYKEFTQYAVNLSASLTRLGVRRGDTVAVGSEKRNEFVPTALAILLNITQPKYFICSKKFWELYKDILQGFECIKQILTLDEPFDSIPSTKNLVAQNVDVELFEPETVLGQTDVALILYSSGTTGLSKGIQLTHLHCLINSMPYAFPSLKYVFQGYGMTEAGEMTSESWSHKGSKTGSVGQACSQITIKVSDLKTRKTVGPNERGEISLKGPVLMKGYVGMDISNYLDEEGFFSTGDLGYYDEDKYFYIVGRLKEIILHDGLNVPPLELETILQMHPGVNEASVVGKPDPVYGELPTAFIVRQPGFNVSEKELVDYMAKEVPPYMELKGGVKFIEEMPKNPRGKILRQPLKDMLKEIKYYVYGKEGQVPAHLNFGKYILDRLRTYKDEIALEYMDTNEKLSYKEFTQYAVNLSSSLTRLGVRRGDTVAVGSEKRNEFLPTALAIFFSDESIQTDFVFGEWYHNYDIFMTWKFLAMGEITSESCSHKGPKTGSVGQACSQITIKVSDLKTRKTVGPNERGEICVKGPVLMKGYVGMDLSNYLDDEGFFRTGDLGYYDEDEYFYIVGRLKEIISHDGLNVPPLELETILQMHPGVREASVVGKPDPVYGELPTAFIVRQPGFNVSEKELVDFIAEEEHINTNEKLSYKEFTQYAVNLSASLTRLGVRRGDTVAVGSEKGNEVVPTALAIDILQGFKSIKHILTLDDPFDSISSTRNLVAENVDVELFEPETVLGQTDDAFIFYSSGTTGLSKAINVVFVVPSLVSLLSKEEEIEVYKLDSLKIVYSTSCPLHKKTIEKVSDLKTRKTVGPNERGEICVKGPVLMKGYVGMDLSNYLDDEGFFRTGDLGYYDEDELLH